MKIERCFFEGVYLMTPKVFPDSRGAFLEAYHKERYHKATNGCEFVQNNLSISKYGTIRGMHFQSSPGQAKMIMVMGPGKILDVFVDIRRESKTFGKWGSVELEGSKHQQLFLPVGFAHGFCCLSEEAWVFYMVNTHYSVDTEKSFRFDDPEVGIKWPIQSPILSEKDAKAPLLKELMNV